MNNQKLLRWAHLTSNELDQINRSVPVVIPIGSIEAHGHHLPLGTDTMITESIARRACEETGAILMPPIYFAYLGATKNYTGAIDISAELYISLLKATVRSIHKSKFHKIILLNGHAANKYSLEIAIRGLLDELEETGLKLQYRSWWDNICRVHHACEIETAVAVAAHGEHILRKDKIADNTIYYPQWRINDWSKQSPHTGGVNGMPSQYETAEGEKIFREALQKTIDLIIDARDQW